MADAAVAPKKSGAGKIILVVVLLLIGYGIYKAAGNAVPKTPDDVVARAASSMAEVKTAEFAGTLSATIEGSKNPLASLTGTPTDATQPVSFSVGVTGVSEFGNWEHPKSSLKIKLTSALFPNNGSAELELRTIDIDKFLKLNTAPVLGSLNLSSITNMWVKVESKQGADTAPVVTPSTTMTDAQADKVKSILRGSHILRVIEDMGEADVAGIKTHHYKVEVDEAEAMRVSREISEAVHGKAPSIEDEQKMTEFWSRTEIKNGQVWVGVSDYYIYRTSFDATVAKTDKQPSSGTLSLDLQLRNFNKPVTVEVPTGTKSMQEIMLQLLTSGGLKLPTGMMR